MSIEKDLKAKFGPKWKGLVVVLAGMVVLFGVMVIAHFTGHA